MDGAYRFFSNKKCEFYPCHNMGDEDINCLFCYCPLYCLGDSCGGNPVFHDGIKDCSACTFPHHRAHYDAIMARFGDIVARMAELSALSQHGENDIEHVSHDEDDAVDAGEGVTASCEGKDD